MRLVDLLVDRTAERETGTFVFEGEDLLRHQEDYSRGDATAKVKLLPVLQPSLLMAV